MSPDYGTWTTSNYPFNPQHDLREMQRAIDQLRSQQLDSLRMRAMPPMGDWGPSPKEEPPKPKDCGHKKLNSKYYNQLVDYYCQADSEVKKMRDVDCMKNCCIIKYVKEH
jgi:hypothetical protein